MAVPFVSSAQVEATSGAMQLGGKIKWLYIYQAESEDQVGAGPGQLYGFDGTAMEQFVTTNVELDIAGVLGENIAYSIILQASDYTLPNQMATLNGGLSGAGSSYNELTGSQIGVRQAVIQIANVLPNTVVTVGTAAPAISTYQGRATNDWDMINLPLINMANFAGGGPVAYNPVGLGWQATGVAFTMTPMDSVELMLGMANGFSSTPNTQIARDLEMVYGGYLKIMPSEGSAIQIGYVSEGWQENLAGTGPGTEQQNMDGYIASVSMASDQMEFTADWMEMKAVDYQPQLDKNKVPEIVDHRWTGYQVTLGVFLTEQIEALVRYELLDPNMADSLGTLKATGYNSKYDELQVTTVGINYLLSDNAEVAVNYLMIAEEGKEIDMDPNKPTKNAGAGMGERQVVNNDTILVQVQVWQ
jgi:hypothetical protein